MVGEGKDKDLKPEKVALKPARYVQSVERALDILDTLAAARGGMTLMGLSRSTGLHVSTCHHLVMTLANRGYVTRERRTKEFRLGNKLFEITHAHGEQVNLSSIAMPFLQDLNARTGEATHLAVLVADELVTLIKLDSTHAVKVDNGSMGKSNAAHATATGRALLAFLPEGELEHMFPPKKLVRFTDQTVTSLETLRNICAEVRRDGFSEDVEEFQPGVHCVGAPIRDHTGAVVASVSCATPTMRMDGPARQQMREDVMDTAVRISRELGCRPGEPPLGLQGGASG